MSAAKTARDYTMESLWPHGGEIRQLCYFVGNTDFEVGRYGVTRIEKTYKPGENAYVPYVRIWQGEHLHAEAPFLAFQVCIYAPPENAPEERGVKP